MIDDVYFKILILLIFSCIMVVMNRYDRWSTLVLFKFNKAYAVNETFRNQMVQRNLKDDSQNEMNVLARRFMIKFGKEKGMKIFSIVFVFPLIVIICLFFFFDIIEPFTLVAYSSFYFGAMYVQFLRARMATKLMKQHNVEVKDI